MWTFIIAGSLYLVGIACILVVKPSFMFTPDGNWKEFGIGKSKDRYTTFPFWLFCLVWAVISYILVLACMPRETVSVVSQNKRVNIPRNTSELQFDDELDAPSDLPKGYYVLNKKATKLSGVPKYVYLGSEEPSA